MDNFWYLQYDWAFGENQWEMNMQLSANKHK